MRRLHYILPLAIVLVVAIVASCTVCAQNSMFSANANASKIGVKDQIQVDYTIQDVENLRSIARPDFKDFEVAGGPFSSQSNRVSIVGNKMVQSMSVTHSYVLVPKKIGTLTVPPAYAKDASGHVYESNSLNIEVVQGSLARQQQPQAYDPFNDPNMDPWAAIAQQRRQAMQQRQQQLQQRQQQSQQEAEKPVDVNEIQKDLFIKVTVDKNKAYVGEQITASYKLYARIPMNVGISKLPSLNGFWTQDFDIPKGNVQPTEEIIDGKKYQVFLLKKSALFPQQTGSLVLDPAEAEGNARIITQVRQRNPFGNVFDDPFFQQFGSLMMSDPFFNDDFFSTMTYRDVPVHLKSTPVKVTVMPLPETARPEDFGNAVGNFTVSGKIDKASATTDDALTYTMTIQGSGNLKLIEAPKLNLPNGLSTYDPQILDTITGRTTTISGSKIITWSISPNVPGDYDIPAVPFSFYNPQTGSYVTLHTQPVKLSVAKGKHYNPVVAKNESLTDIHGIVSKPLKEFKAVGTPLFFTGTYWALYALPLVVFGGFLFWKRREEDMLKDMVKFRSSRANKVALKRLTHAKKLLQQNAKEPFYDEVSKALWLYLSDKLNIPLSSLSRDTAHEALNANNITNGILARIDNTITDCETALYAPYSGVTQMQQTYRDAVDIISKLEESI